MNDYAEHHSYDHDLDDLMKPKTEAEIRREKKNQIAALRECLTNETLWPYAESQRQEITDYITKLEKEIDSTENYSTEIVESPQWGDYDFGVPMPDRPTEIWDDVYDFMPEYWED